MNTLITTTVTLSDVLGGDFCVLLNTCLARIVADDVTNVTKKAEINPNTNNSMNTSPPTF